MKHALLALCACGALAGCASRSHGSWLDTYGMPSRTPPGLDVTQATSMREEIARLQGEAEALRMKLAAEPDRIRRMEYLKQLRANHDQVQPLRNTLRYGSEHGPKVPFLVGPGA